MPAYAVVFDAPAAVVRERNRARGEPVPARSSPRSCARPTALGASARRRGLRRRPPRRPGRARPARVPDRAGRRRPPAGGSDAARLRPADLALRLPGAPGDDRGARSPSVARAAEEAGFTSLWVMDHFVQIPQVGREWEDMLESYTTLGYLAGVTERIRLGTLVTGITYRNLAHLAKIVATLDVLSGGRALCGIGAAWFEREHRLYGWEFPPLARALRAARGRARAAAADVGPGRRRASRAARSPSRRRSATRGRCRSASRSSSAARASGARCGSSRATPTPATCSATPTPSAARSPSCTSTAPPRAATRPRSRSPTSAPPASSAPGEPREGPGATPPSRSTSAATASSPRPACRRRSSASPTRSGRSRSAASRDVIGAFAPR